MGASRTHEYALKKLQNLQENTNYLAYITFEHLTSYDEFSDWFHSKELLWKDLWCAVYAENKAGHPFYHVGFIPYHSGTFMYYDEERYPLLCSNGEISYFANGETMKTHFIRMLKYIRDNETFYKMARMIGQDDTPIYDFDALIQRIEFTGLQTDQFPADIQ